MPRNANPALEAAKSRQSLLKSTIHHGTIRSASNQIMKGSDLVSVRAIVRGYVQGVFFRAFAEREAKTLGLVGYVSNLSDGKSVEVRAEGERGKLQALIESLKAGPPQARVKEVETQWSEYSGRYATFSVR